MRRSTMCERNILFLCIDNSCSSQIAEAIAKRLAPPKTQVYSAGIFPSRIDPIIEKIMQEVGVDISNQYAKGIEEIPTNEIDLVVSLGLAKEKCPALPAKARLEQWPIPDLQRTRGGEAAMQAALRYVRDEIDKKVAALFLDHWRNVA